MKKILKFCYKIFKFCYKKTVQFCSKYLGIIPNWVLLKKMEELSKNISNIEFKQNIIMDYYIDVKQAKQATGNLRKFQKQDVELLKEFVRICDKHNLRYWLDFGSLLGAVRHGGFIPWDDDCDVSMPESDFIKFSHLVQYELNPNMQYLNWVENKMARFVFKQDELQSFLDIYAYKEDGNLLKTTLPFTNIYARMPVERDIILPTSEIMFEGLNIKGPHNNDLYLSIRYGNYHQLPKHPNDEIGHEKINEHINVNFKGVQNG